MQEALAVPPRPQFPPLVQRQHVLKVLIDGKWLDALSERSFTTIDPATGQVLAQIAEGEERDIDRAVAAARRAFEGEWSKLKPADRQRLLLRTADIVEKNFDELALLDALDMGMPITKSRGNSRMAVGQLRYNAGLATAIHGQTIEPSLPGDFAVSAVKEPIGVVGVILAWNGPVGSFLRKVAPALAAGCTTVVKPSELSPLSAIRLGELFLEAGLPPGVLNIVTGGGKAGEALARHMDVDMISFTGSHTTGQSIIKASAGNVKKVLVELGGKSPNVVFASADLDVAVPGAAMAVFNNSGQICSAGTRMLVEDKIYDTFVERVAEYARKLRMGDSLDPATVIGPVASQKQRDRIEHYIKSGKQEGARMLKPSDPPSQKLLADGYFVSPTVFADVDNKMTIAREEIFGPVLSAIRFKDFEEAMEIANSTPFGLGAGIWTTDLKTANRASRRIRAGSVWINCYNNADPSVPFGGYKLSGYGRERGQMHLEEHLQTKAIWTNLS